MGDTGAKLGSDRDYRKEAQSDEFGRSGSDPNLAPGAAIFWERVVAWCHLSFGIGPGTDIPSGSK
jgi:hypothetical protein